MQGFKYSKKCNSKIVSVNWGIFPAFRGENSRWLAKASLIALCLSPLSTFASWYTGGAILLHPLPYHTLHSNYIKLGSSRESILGNGIAINAGYKFCLKQRFMLATEFDIGYFSDADGNLEYQGLEHFVSASYYMALKQKFGYYITPNFLLYGFLGISQNSVGDRVYSTVEYFNKKQISVLFGGGLEYYTKRYRNVALFVESFYFTPTNKTLYSGGANQPPNYSLSVYGAVLQFGMRYYFE